MVADVILTVGSVVGTCLNVLMVSEVSLALVLGLLCRTLMVSEVNLFVAIVN